MPTLNCVLLFYGECERMTSLALASVDIPLINSLFISLYFPLGQLMLNMASMTLDENAFYCFALSRLPVDLSLTICSVYQEP